MLISCLCNENVCANLIFLPVEKPTALGSLWGQNKANDSHLINSTSHDFETATAFLTICLKKTTKKQQVTASPSDRATLKSPMITSTHSNFNVGGGALMVCYGCFCWLAVCSISHHCIGSYKTHQSQLFIYFKKNNGRLEGTEKALTYECKL